MKAIITLAVLLLVSLSSLHAQHVDTEKHHDSSFFRAAVELGHTFIPEAHSGDLTVVSSWGLDLEYWLNHRWGFGLHNDLELETFIVKGEEGEQVERVYPLVFTLEGFYTIYEGLVFQIGPGIELEPSENFFLIRFGFEYKVPIGEKWDMAPTFFYDRRYEAYDTWTVGICVGRHF
ncbi:MAG: hypothetical protein MRY78_12215 [Saprospiraceae bacterium]|nr:hypothetical protein [Saprospiraceae bacterium]